MLWYVSWLPFWWSVCINMMQDRSRSPDIYFGASLSNISLEYGIYVLNTPSWTSSYETIMLQAHMIPKCNPVVDRAFAYDIMNFFFLPRGDNFGSNTSPTEYEPLGRAKSFLAENLSRNEPPVMKYAESLSLVKFDVEYDLSRVSYTQAATETIHKCVYNTAKECDVNTPHSPFVDETLIVETRRNIPTTMAAIIEEFYVVLGCEKLSERKSIISMDNFAVHKCSW